MNNIVIIGAGQAAAWAAHTLRQQGFTGRLSIVSNEERVFYERPPLSKQVLAGDMAAAALQIFNDEAIAAMNIDWHKPVSAERIDRNHHLVILDDGTTLPYDKLLIATGSRARLPHPHWGEINGVYTMRNVDDCHQLRDQLEHIEELVLIGGGWIGLEIAATARKSGVKVTVLELGSRLCARSVSAEVSELIFRHHQNAGVDVVVACGQVELLQAANGQVLIQRDGQDWKTVDAVVVGAGAHICKELAVDAGLDTQDGIVVDAFGQSSDPDIYAAGDVAIHPELGFCIQSWANAQNQAIVAAKAMLGETEPYADIPWLWSDQYDLNIQILGTPIGHEKCALVERQTGDKQHSFLYLNEQNQLHYLVAVNDAKLVKMAKRWMKAGTSLQASDLANPDFNVLSIKAN
ncbi:FAD-dependent oxidoreductase [Vitreoscilla massiliensis]|uniref:FAD-dependent oxidoreductase n=1 Tax=Vitreoscilla massiliensis TaxID=1689272 RepID=A0ABY4E2K7_9NEIS|nr:FAD-dependent oxidoreductase [Vitreoscilla massiliensis]UOO89744.1 FAD-dependent oxidoreductase [Vitreoscilla massiliensis]